ncbi:MAG: transcription factor S [Euryarchaeota archaeon]|nr:transcription factor S [Euryarchaeota archaeon]
MFCPKCGSIMRPKEKGKTELVCSKPECAYEEKLDNLAEGATTVIRTGMTKKEVEDCPVVGSTESIMPTTDATCPKCSHPKAYWYLRQTRKSDEPETTFLTCCQCGHKWRAY